MPALTFMGMMTLCIPAAGSPSSPPKSDNGFYARLGLGVGRGKVTSEIDVPQNNWSVEYEGVGWLLDAVAGGTIDGWLAFGGGLFLMEVPAPAIDAEPGRVTLIEALSQGRLGVGTLGPVVDVLFGPRQNAYVGVIVGWAASDSTSRPGALRAAGALACTAGTMFG